MFRTVLIALIVVASMVALTGCRTSAPERALPAAGTARLDKGEGWPDPLIATARLDRRTMGENEYALIVIEHETGPRLEFFDREFAVGEFELDLSRSLSGFHVSMRNDAAKEIYMGDMGRLVLTEVTDERIVGRFDLQLHNMLSSCMRCPGSMRAMTGEFHAARETE